MFRLAVIVIASSEVYLAGGVLPPLVPFPALLEMLGLFPNVLPIRKGAPQPMWSMLRTTPVATGKAQVDISKSRKIKSS